MGMDENGKHVDAPIFWLQNPSQPTTSYAEFKINVLQPSSNKYYMVKAFNRSNVNNIELKSLEKESKIRKQSVNSLDVSCTTKDVAVTGLSEPITFRSICNEDDNQMILQWIQDDLADFMRIFNISENQILEKLTGGIKVSQSELRADDPNRPPLVNPDCIAQDPRSTLLGKYNPFDTILFICTDLDGTMDENSYRGTIRHELMHAVQRIFAPDFISYAGYGWIYEGTARASERSDSTYWNTVGRMVASPEQDKTLRVDQTFNFLATESGQDKYDHQQFWVYAGQMFNSDKYLRMDLVGLKYMKNIFEKGSENAAPEIHSVRGVDLAFKDMGFPKGFSDVYWMWANDQVIVHNPDFKTYNPDDIQCKWVYNTDFTPATRKPVTFDYALSELKTPGRIPIPALTTKVFSVKVTNAYEAKVAIRLKYKTPGLYYKIYQINDNSNDTFNCIGFDNNGNPSQIPDFTQPSHIASRISSKPENYFHFLVIVGNLNETGSISPELEVSGGIPKLSASNPNYVKSWIEVRNLGFSETLFELAGTGEFANRIVAPLNVLVSGATINQDDTLSPDPTLRNATYIRCGNGEILVYTNGVRMDDGTPRPVTARLLYPCP